MSSVMMLLKFEHTHASNQFNDGFSEEVSSLGFRWKSRTGGFLNSDKCDPPWYEQKGVEIERTYTVNLFMPEGVATAYLDLVGIDKFLETVDFSWYVKKYDLKNLRLEEGR